VNRTLRVLALVGLLGNVTYLVGFAWIHAGTLSIGGASSDFGALVLKVYVLQVTAWLGTTFTYIAGVVAAVAAVQRRQRRWAVAVIGVLALHALYPLFTFIVSYVPLFATPAPTWVFIALVEGPFLHVVAATLALLALVYSVLSSPTDAASSSRTGGESPAPSR
jgi:dolichyl-phosphate-mannose--protein O-mannosyl transferase